MQNVFFFFFFPQSAASLASLQWSMTLQTLLPQHSVGRRREPGSSEPALLPNPGRFCVSVPTEDPSGESLIISPEEFERIKWASQVLTKEELEAREQAFKKEKEAILVTHLHSLVLGGWAAGQKSVVGKPASRTRGGKLS